MASDMTQPILDALSTSDGPILSNEAFPSTPSLNVKSALDRLASRSMVEYETKDKEVIALTPEGEDIAANGSHEAKVFEAVVAAMDGLKIGDLPGIVGKENAKVGQGNAFKKGWIKKDKDVLRATTESIVDDTRELMLTIKKTQSLEDQKAITDLKRRKLIALQKVITFRISKGPKFAKEFVKEETDLTAEMLANGSWKTATLKPYNFKAKGAPTPAGTFHPLNKVRQEFRNIFFEMGFEEMPTNRFVETGFWNFDALYVPQQHPARDLQDTFYIADPAVADPPREDPLNDPHRPKSVQPASAATTQKPLDYQEYWDNVRQVHENGKYGSIGYRYPWNKDEALRLVLRTHTTSVSTYMLHKLAQNPRPARYFSIDRVFRNEAVDATHLAEFHQIEGVIADFGLTLGGLIGFMEVFFAKMGIHQLRFKPAYNPYTEPSMEIFGYHEGLGKWVEIGNSGMFRPEMLEPMGLPKDMRVYGWGLSLERPTMIKYAVSNIRELLGHKVDLNFIETNPAVRLEKD
ncbi:phenylalanine--tRNA ligase subunit alpha [Aspergillus clavatus NRRL 1]|uniref:Phenylalanine--tRNA ligase alpha subunit n=1 Tax=Aspergillus clavatus (strain ATCC 1007 / CBS 513.65 / DSM 816 / NCTC 3887 / NRRL 1 / QM 1276 / 107) TaxID=344612 RepID=A1CEV0_ASPCL|nr:phenylalanyl-tRNA synthetase beta chain cytoplasmic [Aspergillus clavatus NRRL 1]EAW11399.1 phenylalanyl-tRNA synthetase beta chain cytoplasmic [Aspergillus clavatus NRRL 1]